MNEDYLTVIANLHAQAERIKELESRLHEVSLDWQVKNATVENLTHDCAAYREDLAVVTRESLKTISSQKEQIAALAEQNVKLRNALKLARDALRKCSAVLLMRDQFSDDIDAKERADEATAAIDSLGE